MKTHKKNVLRLIALGGLSLLGSFILGIETAGDVQPFGHSEAAQANHFDVDSDGTLTSNDAYLALQFALGYREPTQAQLESIPEGKFTTDTVLKMLSELSHR